MPVTIKSNSKGGYSVSTPHGVKAKNTSYENAKAQERLLNGIEHNPEFAAKIKKENKVRSK